MDSNTDSHTVAGSSSPAKCRFSIVIPVLNEQERINSVVEHLRGLRGSESCEIIVVDGGPGGGTIKAIKDKAVIALTCQTGRARQMNRGAAAARGEFLVFLHADTKLPAKAFAKIAKVLKDKRYVAGAFDLGIDSERLILRYIAARARMRSRVNRIPYGDQAVFMRKSYFEQIGRFREIPIMEDIDLMRRIKKRGDKILILRERVMTSPRRWEKEGVVFATLRNQVLVGLYYLGVAPEKLARFYRGHTENTTR